MTSLPSLSPIRKTLLWVFSEPASPFMSLSVAIDFQRAQVYLRDISKLSTPAPTVQHLLCGVIGRILKEVPIANCRVVGSRLLPFPSIGVAMPVNLIGHPGGSAMETSLAMISDLEHKTLLDIAAVSRTAVHAERSGRSEQAFSKVVWALAARTPQPILNAVFDRTTRLGQHPWFANQVFQFAPVSTLLSNVGAAMRSPQGVLTRGANAAVPARLAMFATAWGTGPVQDEVVAIEGKPEVRAMLPLSLFFDHRVMDGVTAARLIARFAEILKAPESVFGEMGDRPIGFS